MTDNKSKLYDELLNIIDEATDLKPVLIICNNHDHNDVCSLFSPHTEIQHDNGVIEITNDKYHIIFMSVDYFKLNEETIDSYKKLFSVIIKC